MTPRLLVAAALALVAPVAPAADDLPAKLAAVMDGPDYAHAVWGALVVDATTGKTLFSRNPDAMFAPASVTKMFSCAAALVALGPDSRTETAVYRRGSLFGGVLRGDLVLVAAGDLTFGGRTKADGTVAFADHDHTYANSGLVECELTPTDPLAGLADLAKQVKASGVSEVRGDVLVDDRLFARGRGTGSGPDLVTPILVNDNVVDIVVTPAAKTGDPATVTTRPESSFYQADAVVTTGPPGGATDVQVLAVGPNQFAVRGRVPAGGKPVVRIYPVDDPAVFARTLFVESLRRAGVVVQASVTRPGGAALPERAGSDALRKVATFRSAPLKDAVAVTLKVSHNLYASTLPALIAASRKKDTIEAGLAEEAKILKELGVDVTAVSFNSGAGGGTADYVSPRATVQLLQGMAKRPEWEAFRAGLPLLGVDGTLADVVPATSPARGKAAAKTGTLVWHDAANGRWLLKSKALAGVTPTRRGGELVFALFVNNNPLPAGVAATREGKALGALCEAMYEFGPGATAK